MPRQCAPSEPPPLDFGTFPWIRRVSSTTGVAGGRTEGVGSRQSRGNGSASGCRSRGRSRRLKAMRVHLHRARAMQCTGYSQYSPGEPDRRSQPPGPAEREGGGSSASANPQVTPLRHEVPRTPWRIQGGPTCGTVTSARDARPQTGTGPTRKKGKQLYFSCWELVPEVGLRPHPP